MAAPPCPHHALNKNHHTLHAVSGASPSEGEKPRRDPSLTWQVGATGEWPLPCQIPGPESPGWGRGWGGLWRRGCPHGATGGGGEAENLLLLLSCPPAVPGRMEAQNPLPGAPPLAPQLVSGKGGSSLGDSPGARLSAVPGQGGDRQRAGQARARVPALPSPRTPRLSAHPPLPSPRACSSPWFSQKSLGGPPECVAPTGNAPQAAWRTHTEGPFSLGS